MNDHDEFNPIWVVVGLGFFLSGLWALSHIVSLNPWLLPIEAIVAVFTSMGVIILVDQYRKLHR